MGLRVGRAVGVASCPTSVFYPTGGGVGLIGMWKAFDEMERMGLVHAGRRPRMIVVQAEGCAPMVRAFEQGEERADRWKDPHTYASGLRVPAAIGDHLILGAVRESGGVALAVSDADMTRGQREMAGREGIFPAPEGGATLAALRQLVAQGTVTSTRCFAPCSGLALSGGPVPAGPESKPGGRIVHAS